jgi:hypothetical protein
LTSLDGSVGEGLFGFWLPKRWDNILSCDLYCSHDTCNIVVWLSFVRELILILFGILFGCEVFFVVEASLLVVKLWGSQKVSPSFPRGPQLSASILLTFFGMLS